MSNVIIAGLLVMTSFGCDGTPKSSITVQEGSLVSLAEGEHLELHVSGATSLGAADPAWAVLDGDRLVLAPPCNTVHGTSDPPKLFTLQLAASDHSTAPLAVEVRPSGTGSCEPTLLACSSDKRCPTGNGMSVDNPSRCTRTSQLGMLAIDYVINPGFSDLTKPDRSLVFSLANPDDSDFLAGQVTTDAPVRFHPFSPGDVPNPTALQTDFCAELPNTNITGDFTVTYLVARTTGSDVAATSLSPVVGGGAFPLTWNDRQLFGAEILWCAASGNATCALKRTPTAPNSDDIWCIEKPQPTASISLGLRIWAGHTPGHVPGSPDQYDLDLDVPEASTLTSTRSIKSGTLRLQIDRQTAVEPEVVVAALDAATTSFTITLARTGLSPFTRTVSVKASCP